MYSNGGLADRRMKLLMLSWRYLGHPAGGGAEVLTHETLARLVAAGHSATCFTAAHPSAPAREHIDGVEVIRNGRQWTVHVHAWRWLRRRVDDYDVVIDQINTIPFFTPLYVPAERRRFLIFQQAREYWWRQAPGPFKLMAPIGYLAEPHYLKLYRRTCGMTISDSTRRELEEIGIPLSQVDVIPTALNVDPLDEIGPRSGPFTVIMLSRLMPAKFVEEGIEAFGLLQGRAPEARLHIVGDGAPSYRARLERLVEKRAMRHVVFHGRVDDRTKMRLLAQAHVHLFTSHREGWGLVVSEAAAVGTPTVAYDAPGVRDSVQDPRMLAPIGDVSGLAERLALLHHDPALWEEVRAAAWSRAREMSYDNATRLFRESLERPCAAS
ncbi:MAG TPA: glycosyltransferase family 4 protein [Thermoleophilaceae bacterium]